MIYGALSPLISVTESLKDESRAIFLYGMGNGAGKIYQYLCSHGIEIKGVVASDEFVRGQSFLGFEVLTIGEAEKQNGELCLVLCFGLEGEKSHFLKNLSKKHRIISPNLPVFGEGACDKEFILSHVEQFERVYDALADDGSKEIYLNLLKYNITGEIGFLDFGNNLEAPSEFFEHSLRHIDVGAYDGDTVAWFAEKNQAYSDIVAFEPDKITFKKLSANTELFRNVICENAAVAQKAGEIAFASGQGRASHAGEGKGRIRLESIDAYCGFSHIKAEGIPVGSIKIDAEGMDEEVICGAVNTIYCCNCAVCVALYHRAGDLIDLPLLLKKHNSKFRFYLRKKEYVPAWDVFLYAIPKNK